jgi:predicted small secreted protein
MLSLLTRILLVVLLAVTLAGCSAIAGIFKAGLWTGIIIAVVVVVVIAALVGRR